MWRYLQGVAPPPHKKAKLNDEQRKERDREYEKQRSRSFLADWQKGRDWLTYDKDKNEMWCSCCKQFSTSQNAGSFVQGTNRFKLENIQTHEKSVSHSRCLAIHKVKDNPSTSATELMFTKMSSYQATKMSILFRNAHALAKQARPFTDYTWMCTLDKKKGLKIGKTYNNRKQAQKFIGYIADVERQKLRDQFHEAKYLTLTSDGSTDSSIIEEEIIYARYAMKAEVHVHFCSLHPVGKADAENITNAIMSGATKVLPDWQSKLVAVASDGASVMTGKKTGVVTRLKKDTPHLVGIHGMAHRLELAYKDAVKNNKLHQDLETLLMGLYNFYHYSPLNRSNLKAAYTLLDMTPLMPTRVGGTRWVGHQKRALDNFLNGYQAILLHLEQIQSPDAQGVNKDQQAKAKNFFKLARSADMVAYVCFMHDVLDQLSKLSEKMQKKKVTMAEVCTSLECTKAVLCRYQTKSGPMLIKLDAEEKGTFKKTNLEGEMKGFQSSRRDLLEDLRQCLEHRFEDTTQDIIQATKLLNFQKYWPNKENMKDFGDSELDTLVTHFSQTLQSAGVEVEKIQDEWEMLKSAIYNWSERLASFLSQLPRWT